MWFVQNCVPSVAEHVHEILEEKNPKKSLHPRVELFMESDNVV